MPSRKPVRRDVLTPQQRSYCMSQIRSTNTKAEVLVRSALHAEGFRFRIHDGTLPGKPDIVFRAKKIVVFVDGDFWHGRRFGTWSSRLSPKWRQKIAGNKKRDARHSRTLRRQGWQVVRVWESQAERNLEAVIAKIHKVISHRS